MAPEVEVDKKHVRNLKEGTLTWLAYDSLQRCKDKLRHINEISTGNDVTLHSAKVKVAHRELSRPDVKSAPVIDDGVSEIKNRAGNVGATSNHKKETSANKK